MLPQGVCRKGAQQIGCKNARLFTFLAQPVDRLPGGVEAGAQNKENHFRVPAAVALGKVVAPACEGLIFLKYRGDDGTGLLHRQMQLVFVVEDIGLVHVGADGDGGFGGEGRIFGAVLAQKLPHVLIPLPDGAPALLMAGKEAVEGHDGRQLDLFGHLEGAEVEVVHGLGGAGEKDQPAGVEGIHDVAVIPLDGEGAGDSAAGHVHHHGEAGAGLDGELFQGVEQAVGAGGVEYAAPAGGRSIADPRGAVLPLRGDERNIVLPLGFHQVNLFSDLGGGGDGVVAHHVVVDLLGGVGGQLIAALIEKFLRAHHTRPPFIRFSSK